MPNLNINFPVLRNLKISGHALFPGSDDQGINHDFPQGISIIAGINGIGKTTILNLIYHMLVGPWSARKSDNDIRLTSNELTQLKNFDYFSRRDATARTSATATADYTFGSKQIRITRALKNLSLIEIKVDGIICEASEQSIWALSGCGSQYDFHFLMRTVVFFLESKTPVVWDPIAQAELFRILFLSTEDARKMARLATNIQSADSDRRNLIYQRNRYKKQHQKAILASQNTDNITREHTGLCEQIDVINSLLKDFEAKSYELRTKRDELAQKLETQKLELEETYRNLEHAHHRYFASLFPELPTVAKNVFTNLVAGAGCLVCGSRESGIEEKFQLMAREGRCPVCDSSEEHQENCTGAVEFGSELIETENAKVEHLKKQVNEMTLLYRSLSAELEEIHKEHIQRHEELAQLKANAEQLKVRLPAPPEELAKKERFIVAASEEIDELGFKIETMVENHSKTLVSLREEVNTLKGQLSEHFEAYAANFLAEKCGLTFKPQKLKLGEAVERMEYPTFAVQMTSGVSPNLGTTRTEFNDVSESQKEFIDLAFRMAVLKTYSSIVSEERSAMIVIETPEASLDSVFVKNAGRMLRNWCDPKLSNMRNSVIASSNLNRENMISSMLGLGKSDSPYPSEVEVKSRVLNLLDIAAENAALRQHRDHYVSELNKAMTPNISDE